MLTEGEGGIGCLESTLPSAQCPGRLPELSMGELLGFLLPLCLVLLILVSLSKTGLQEPGHKCGPKFRIKDVP